MFVEEYVASCWPQPPHCSHAAAWACQSSHVASHSGVKCRITVDWKKCSCVIKNMYCPWENNTQNKVTGGVLHNTVLMIQQYQPPSVTRGPDPDLESGSRTLGNPEHPDTEGTWKSLLHSFWCSIMFLFLCYHRYSYTYMQTKLTCLVYNLLVMPPPPPAPNKGTRRYQFTHVPHEQ